MVAREVLQRLVTAVDKNTRCMRMYAQPKMMPYRSGSDAVEMRLALNLYVAANAVHPMFREAQAEVQESRANIWFTSDSNTRPPFIVWLCDYPHGKCSP